MIPFKKLLALENDDLLSTLARVVMLLMEAPALHAVEYDREERELFQHSLLDIRERFELSSEKSQVVALAGEAVKSIQDYSQTVEKFVRTVSAEKQSVINMVTETLIGICAKSEATGANLRQIAKDMERTFQLEDTRALKAKMAECLAQISREAVQLDEMAQDLRPRLGGLSAGYRSIDEVTGLPGLNDAKTWVEQITTAGQAAYAVPLFLKNLDIVNRRFGFARGDEVLKIYGHYIHRHLTPADRLFRWRGPCFLAVLKRFSKLETVQAEILKIASAPFEKEIESGDRSMLFRISTAFNVFSLVNVTDPAQVWTRIDAFAADQIQAKA